MVASKRAAADPTKSSNENRRTCSGEGGTTESLISGHKVLFASSGVAIACQGNGTRIVTAASLVRALEKARGNIKIEVHYEGEVVKGVLEEYDLANGIAFVKAMTTLDVHCVPLSHIDLMPETKVVVVSRDISGKLMATSGELRCSDGFGKFGNGEAGGCLMMFSTCKASEGWQGGPSFDFDGNFVGMNLVLDMERSIIFPRSRIALLNAHHDPFGDLYPDGVWGEFDRSFSAFLSKNVVALASFNGGTKFFSCTGFFINFDDECQTILTSATLVREPDGSHKIVEGLEIKVLLPNNQSKVGTLKHFSLQYNVALVGVKNCRYVRHVNLEECSRNYSSEVVAVGRSFESGELMATRGARTCWSGPFDCDLLCYSTCKISKIGIGGPLVDINGKFLGMNYYDKKMGTPFLYFDDLCGILQYFKTKQWKLPNPSSMNKRERDEERRVLASLHPTSRRHVQYA
ncbi:hypothetical protein BDA96_04G171500 [Sorghum bicolor]|uniref:Protease Do-like 14 n=1 Tax=Sorghum bicolor TaxID=4558 RepID=A0A921R4A1_SORBI|nr:hypothetical protein BDA96_04G171500 [Sorghum bicolor]